MKNKQLPEWAAPVSAVAVPAAVAGVKLLRGGVPNPFILAAAAAGGYAIPRAWNEVVARHTDDAEFEKEFRLRKREIIAKTLGKEAGLVTGIGGLVGKGLKYIGAGAKDVAKAVVMKPKATAPLGEKLLRPLALAGTVGVGYAGGKALINSSKPYNYGTYERNLVNYGYITPDQMSRSGFNTMVKQSSAVNAGMNLLMGGFAITGGIAAAKKVKTPVMGSAIQQSAVYGGAGAGMNNFR